MRHFVIYILKRTSYNMLLLGLIAGGFFFASNMQTGTLVIQPPKEKIQQRDIKGTPEYVFHQHRRECWTMGDQPKASIPSAAIVQFSNGRVVYTKKHQLVDAALSEALAMIGYDEPISIQIDPIALCK